MLILANPSNGEKDISSKVYLAENSILREVQLNNTYRTYIMTIDDSVEFDEFDIYLKNHITNRSPEYLNCTGKICDFAYDPVCDIDSLEKNIYAKSIMIVGDSTKYEPKLFQNALFPRYITIFYTINQIN